MALLLYLTVFAVALWLGLYLIARNPARALLRRVAYGLLAYAVALAAACMGELAGLPLAELLLRIYNFFVVLPALCWAGALALLLPEDDPLRLRLDRAWRFGLLPLGLAALLVRDIGLLGSVAVWLVATLALLPILGGAALITQVARNQRNMGMFAVTLLFFGLGIGLLFFPVAWLPLPLVLFAIGIDLILLGLAIAILDAFDEGETLRLHIARSVVAAGAAALIFAMPVAVALAFGAGPPLVMVALLLALIALAISMQTLADPMAALLDRLVFARRPQLQQQRMALREVAGALPRAQSDLDPTSTRRSRIHQAGTPGAQ